MTLSILLLTALFIIAGLFVIGLFFWRKPSLDDETFQQGVAITGVLTTIVVIVGVVGTYKFYELELNVQDALIKVQNSELKQEIRLLNEKGPK